MSVLDIVKLESMLGLLVALFVAPGFSLDIYVSYHPNTNSYILNGNIHPNVQCDIGEEVNFYISAKNYPFSIWVTKKGVVEPWHEASDQGVELGVISMPCDVWAGKETLYYNTPDSSDGKHAASRICVGYACQAEVCSRKYCWGTPDVPTDSYADTAQYVVNFTSALEADFATAIEETGNVTNFQFSSKTNSAELNVTYYSILVNYITTDASFARSVILSVFVREFALDPLWFILNPQKTDDGVIIDTLYVFPPVTQVSEGQLDVLFFESAYPRCNIHTTDTCPTSARNLVGEYAHPLNQIKEKTCTAGVTEYWKYFTLDINPERTGGKYKWHCDSLCRICKYEGEFNNDGCQCTSANELQYCLSVKFDGASACLPSIFVLIAVWTSRIF